MTADAPRRRVPLWPGVVLLLAIAATFGVLWIVRTDSVDVTYSFTASTGSESSSMIGTQRVRPGEPVAFPSLIPQPWRLTVNVRRLSARTYLIKCAIAHAGKLVEEPELCVTEGQPATVTLQEADGRTMSLELKVRAPLFRIWP